MIKFKTIHNNNIIKIIGIGGGGCNAVNYMSQKGIEGVSYTAINTDQKQLETIAVNEKVILGEGLGAGSDPEIARQAAENTQERIKTLLSNGTKMAFLVAGMGGGTGTGASPVIARIAKEMDILTVAITTTPFEFEGGQRKEAADQGLEKLIKIVDSISIINNEKMLSIYGNLEEKDAFAKADDVLYNAVSAITEIIEKTNDGINRDFADVRTTLKEGGVTIIGVGEAEGENRAIKALENALTQPLLKESNIQGAKRILYNIKGQTKLNELAEIGKRIKEKIHPQAKILVGKGRDQNLGEKIRISIIAAELIGHKNKNKIIQTPETQTKIKHQINSTETEETNSRTYEFEEIIQTSLNFEEAETESNKEIEEFKTQLKYNLGSKEYMETLKETPAYIRRKIRLEPEI